MEVVYRVFPSGLAGGVEAGGQGWGGVHGSEGAWGDPARFCAGAVVRYTG